MPQIRVHERALAHLSRGLYRSPASALRELVSNAWDANATLVTIDTNYPNFFQLVVQDNGDGFAREEFERLMEGGIGNSEKRVDERQLKFGRPIIGRLGIGMLGIAQICGSFVVMSRPRQGEGFRARVRLYDLAKSRMDEPNSELIHDAETTVDGETVPSKIVDVGDYSFEDFDDERISYGTTILADDVTPTFTKAFQDSLSSPNYKPVPLDWGQAVRKTLNKVSSLQLLGDYWRLLWELAAESPVPYLSNDALPRSAIRELNERLSSYNFNLVVDGRHLYRPVYLKGNPGGYTTNVIGRQSLKVYGKPLVFSGYIVVQEGAQLKPDELRGIMVRIKNIGIGRYDASMLDYRINEGPRSRWLTGEIFVEQGLEDALNIDRDSFNQFHPEYRSLQSALHEILQTKVFPEVYKNIDVRSRARKARISEDRAETLRAVVSASEGRTVRLKTKRATEDLSNEAPQYSEAKKDGHRVEVSVQKPEHLPTSKASQQLAQAILAIFEIALLESSKRAQRAKFSELLFALLKKW